MEGNILTIRPKVLLLFLFLLIPQSSRCDEGYASFLDKLGEQQALKQEHLREFYHGDAATRQRLFSSLINDYIAVGQEDRLLLLSNQYLAMTETTFRDTILYDIAYLNYRMGRYDVSRDILLPFISDRESFSSSTQVDLILGNIAFIEKDYTSARQYWSRAGTDPMLTTGTSENLDWLEHVKGIKTRSPKTAAWLATIPGLGYLYAGHPQTALSALIVLGALGGGTWQLFDSGNSGIGALTGFIGFAWYTGSIYGSYQAVDRYNRLLDQHRVGDLPEKGGFLR